MFTKIKINPNLQNILKDFKQKLKVNNKSVNQIADKSNVNTKYLQTECSNNDTMKLPKKVLNLPGNYKNHSISTSNRQNDYSQITQNRKNDNSISNRKLIENNPILSILQTETNNFSNKINFFNKSNNLNIPANNNDKFTTLTSFFNKNSEKRNISPRLQKMVSSEKPNSINYKLIKPTFGTTKNSEKKDNLFTKKETIFNIDNASKIKEQIFNFCKKNMFAIKEVFEIF